MTPAERLRGLELNAMIENQELEFIAYGDSNEANPRPLSILVASSKQASLEAGIRWAQKRLLLQRGVPQQLEAGDDAYFLGISSETREMPYVDVGYLVWRDGRATLLNVSAEGAKGPAVSRQLGEELIAVGAPTCP